MPRVEPGTFRIRSVKPLNQEAQLVKRDPVTCSQVVQRADLEIDHSTACSLKHTWNFTCSLYMPSCHDAYKLCATFVRDGYIRYIQCKQVLARQR
jgi:hypothetical protein